MRGAENWEGDPFDVHPARRMMVAYLTGACSPEEREIVEEHCLDCDACRAQFAALVHMVASSGHEGENQRRRMEAQLPLGAKAAARARRIVRREEGWDRQRLSSQKNWMNWRQALQIFRPILAPALLVIALIGGGLITYHPLWRRAPEDPTLARIREVYRDARILQARVTGGFAHQQYLTMRGPGDITGVDENRRIALLAELNQGSADRSAAARHNLGRLFILRGELEPAERQFLLALNERPRDAGLLADLGALYYERSLKEGDASNYLLGKAVENTSKAIEIDSKLPEAWFNRALCYERMNLFLQAEGDWKQCLTFSDASAWAEEAREHLDKLHEHATRLEKLEQTVQIEFQAAEATGDEIRMRELVTRHFIPIRNLAMDQLFDNYLGAAIAGEKRKSDQYLRTLKEIGRLIREVKGDRFVADTVNFAARGNLTVKKDVQVVRRTLQQATQEHARGNVGAACDLFAKARDVAERIGDHPHAEIAAFGLARYYHRKGESAELGALRNRLAGDTKRRRHLQMHAKVLLTLANAEADAQRLSLRLEHARQAAEIARKLGDAELELNGSRYVGCAYDSLGDLDSAVKWLTEAISVPRDSWVNPIMAAVAYNEMGEILFRKGEYLVALPYQHEAVRMSERSGNVAALALMTQRLGLTYGMLGRQEEAARCLKDAVARAEAIPDQMARLQLQIDMYTKSGDFYLKKKKFNEAIATYRQALERIGGANILSYISPIRRGLATAYMANGQDAEAEAQLKESIRLAEEARGQISDAQSRGSFLASQQSLYRAMISFQFLNKSDPAQAFNYAEIAKGRDLLDELTGSRHVTVNDGKGNLTLSGSATPLTLEQTQRALPANVQLAQYVAGEDRLMIWLVTRERVMTATSNVGAGALRDKVTAYLEALRSRAPIEKLNLQSSELYKLLIGPLDQRLDRKLTLCIAPDGVLQDLPFAALVSPESKRYLIEDFTILVNPSASVFARAIELSAHKQKSDQERFLGFSNPRFDQQRFPGLQTLPASEQELERIESLYPHHLILNRRQATESELVSQIGEYEIVHLATHTLNGKQSSNISTIVLAEENHSNTDAPAQRKKIEGITFDGALQSQEVCKLKPERTRLVVLSSCRSGLGDDTRNEALGGLAQSFLVAGVPAVVASLWDIEDDSAAGLMERFHIAHRVKKLAFGQALREAQLSFLQTSSVKKRHPYFWATFIVTGNGLAD
ncbi:MAG: CHAT domain-containing protein [Chloracidobacterium sp.]|nr:CHAT domain-containing protein [Chloracidobacterium sp.]